MEILNEMPTKITKEHVFVSDNSKEEGTAQLREAIFPNVPPFINFIKMREKYNSALKLDIPWNLWVPCNNPLLLHTMIRAGFTRTQVIN